MFCRSFICGLSVAIASASTPASCDTILVPDDCATIQAAINAGGDVDGDGDTDQADLGALLGNFGADCDNGQA